MNAQRNEHMNGASRCEMVKLSGRGGGLLRSFEDVWFKKSRKEAVEPARVGMCCLPVVEAVGRGAIAFDRPVISAGPRAPRAPCSCHRPSPRSSSRLHLQAWGLKPLVRSWVGPWPLGQCLWAAYCLWGSHSHTYCTSPARVIS